MSLIKVCSSRCPMSTRFPASFGGACAISALLRCVFNLKVIALEAMLTHPCKFPEVFEGEGEDGAGGLGADEVDGEEREEVMEEQGGVLEGEEFAKDGGVVEAVLEAGVGQTDKVKSLLVDLPAVDIDHAGEGVVDEGAGFGDGEEDLIFLVKELADLLGFPGAGAEVLAKDGPEGLAVERLFGQGGEGVEKGGRPWGGVGEPFPLEFGGDDLSILPVFGQRIPEALEEIQDCGVGEGTTACAENGIQVTLATDQALQLIGRIDARETGGLGQQVFDFRQLAGIGRGGDGKGSIGLEPEVEGGGTLGGVGEDKAPWIMGAGPAGMEAALVEFLLDGGFAEEDPEEPWGRTFEGLGVDMLGDEAVSSLLVGIGKLFALIGFGSVEEDKIERVWPGLIGGMDGSSGQHLLQALLEGAEEGGFRIWASIHEGESGSGRFGECMRRGERPAGGVGHGTEGQLEEAAKPAVEALQDKMSKQGALVAGLIGLAEVKKRAVRLFFGQALLDEDFLVRNRGDIGQPDQHSVLDGMTIVFALQIRALVFGESGKVAERSGVDLQAGLAVDIDLMDRDGTASRSP